MATTHFAITRRYSNDLRNYLKKLPNDETEHDMNYVLYLLKTLLQSCEDKEWVRDVERGLRTDVELIYNHGRNKWSYNTEKAGHFMVTSYKKSMEHQAKKQKYLKDTYNIT